MHEHNVIFQGFQKGKAIMKKLWNLTQLSITTSFAPGWMEMLQLLVVVAAVPVLVQMLLHFVDGSWPLMRWMLCDQWEIWPSKHYSLSQQHLCIRFVLNFFPSYELNFLWFLNFLFKQPVPLFWNINCIEINVVTCWIYPSDFKILSMHKAWCFGLN